MQAQNDEKIVIARYYYEKGYFTNNLQAFLFINFLTKHLKINNMRFMNLTMFSDFMQVLHINRRH
jgi:hypothetical protein